MRSKCIDVFFKADVSLDERLSHDETSFLFHNYILHFSFYTLRLFTPANQESSCPFLAHILTDL